jgi:hypothetical protein
MSGYPGGIASGHAVFDPSAFFLQKPFEMDTLGKILRQVLDPDNQT